ncbi:cation transporting P-ATPase, putative [Plasmodium relictum]|uniref:Cation transporting P-ATPase, putative n=1 Tax=Plasmodium relictum TaxID=85471 RepID=A0A1J1H7U9_PLARL|nr:cation transporting P-ATPase, putative [Plasmodium relictum]CRH00629.1 cation transporting P-ATPase, putative [Plasmodium relictum]
MFRFCKSDSLLINYRELKYICFIYIFLLFSFFIWCLCKKHFQNKINKRHKWKNHESIYKNEKAQFFNYIYESSDSDEVIIRQEGYANSFVGFVLKNISIIFYLITHIIIILLIINEYCIYESNDKLWNDRAFVFFIFFLLSFIITYGILTVRKHMHSFFLKPSLLKDSDYVLVYTKNEDYINFYKNIFKEILEFLHIFLKKRYYKLKKFLFPYFEPFNNYNKEKKNSIFQYKKNNNENKYKEFNKKKISKNYENIFREEEIIIKKEKKKKMETKPINKLKVHKVKVRTNEKNIRYFFFRSMKYVYNEKKDAFYNISHSINEKVNNLDFNYILKKGGLNNNEIINNINEYGYNNIHLEFYSFFKNLKRELLDGIYMFQLFITYKNFFWKEMITSLIWLIISMLTVIKKIFKNQNNKKEIYENIQANNNTMVTVYRNSIVQQIPSNNLTIGDIIIITSKMTIPCDCLLLTGNALVDESLLTGESRPMKKICISNLNSFNSFDKINSNESHILSENQENNFIEKQKGNDKKKNLEYSKINKKDYNKQHEYNKYNYNNFNTNNILYAGTDVISTLNFSDNIYAIVINVSIYTYKGKYMQNVLFPNPLLFKYDSQLPIVFIFTIFFSLICLYFQIYYLGFNMTSIFYSIGTLSQILPVWTPVVLNIGLNISTNRLKKEKNVCCIAPSRIPICGKIRIFFFDKTGTLTDHKIELSGVHFCNNILNEKKKMHSRHSNHNKSISDDTYDIKFENFSLLNSKNFKSFYKNNLKKNWNLRDFDYNAPHFLSNNIVEYYSSNNINNNVFEKINMKDKNDFNNASQHSFYSSMGFNDANNINEKKSRNISEEYIQKPLTYYKSHLFALTDNNTYDQPEKNKLFDHKLSNYNNNERSNDNNSQTSTGDIFQSYDELEEYKYYEDEIKEPNHNKKEKNIYRENFKKYNKNNNEKKQIQKKKNGRYNNNQTNYKISHDEVEKYNEDTFVNETKENSKKDQQVSIDMNSNIIKGDCFIKKKQKKDLIKSNNKRGNDNNNNIITKTSNINESTTMNSITSLLYNSKLIWTNKLTLNNTPSNYHLLIYALAGCSCVYYDSNNIYGNEIDKRLFEATEMRISNYINKHDMNIKKITLKMNDEYKSFDILKTYEFDYYTKISTTLSYGYFDFKDKIYIVFSKGSFDKIYQKCIKNDEIFFFKKKEQEYSKNGFYVIALAFKIIWKSSYENILELSREELEKDMNFLSLIMFNNHIKNDAPNVIQTLKDSSIRPIILTGDNAYNCLYVGNKIGLFSKVDFYDSFFSLNINSNINSEIKKNDKENVFQSNETKFLSFENLIKSNSNEKKLSNSPYILDKYNEQPKKKKKNKSSDKKEIDKGNVRNKKYVDIKYSYIKSKYCNGNCKYESEENTLLLPQNKDEKEKLVSNNLNQNDYSVKNSLMCKFSNGKNDTYNDAVNYSNNNTSADNYDSINNSIEDDKNIKDKESSILKSNDQIHFMNNKASYYIKEEKYEENIIVYGHVLNDELIFINIQNDRKISKNIVLYDDIYKEIILTGEAYRFIRHRIFHIKSNDEEFNNKELEEYKNFLLRVRIFSRLTPNNKIEVIKDFINFGYISGMCGDGSNDCGALKISHAGLALSNSDTSVVSPFSSRNENLKSVIDILREGRACLVTSINCYKYMLLYGFMISIIKIVLFMHAHAVMSEYGYLFFDNVILLLLAKSMTLSKPAHKLKTQTPTSSIIGAQTILSLLCTLLVNFFFLYVIIFQFFYVYNLPTSYHMNSSAPKSSWWLMSDNYESFLTCIWFCFQIVNSAFILTFGGKYRKNIFTNYTFMTYYFLINSFLLYLTLGGPNKLTCLFRMNCNNEISKTTKFKILDLFSYSASGLSFYGPNGNNILSRNHKIRFLFLNFLNIAVNIFISKYILCEKLYNLVRKFFNFKNRKIPV